MVHNMLDEVPVGTFHAGIGGRLLEVRELVQVGEIQLALNLNLATSADETNVWEPLRPFVEDVIYTDLFGYKIVSFVIGHDETVKVFSKWPVQAKLVEAMRYWVYNNPAPQAERPWMALSSEIAKGHRSLAAFHESLEDAIKLGGVTIDNQLVSSSGCCSVATKAEISLALDTLPETELIPYLRSREHMFANAGVNEEFEGTLVVIREVLSILDPN